MPRSAKRLDAEHQAYLARKWAGAMAGVVLTRRDDIEVLAMPKGYGPPPDLTVLVGPDGRPAGRRLGVCGRAGDGAVFEDPASHEDRLELPDDADFLPEPTALFLFDNATRAGKYRWLLRPTPAPDDLAAGGNAWADLDDAAVAGIVADVIRWYDARRVRRTAA